MDTRTPGEGNCLTFVSHLSPIAAVLQKIMESGLLKVRLWRKAGFPLGKIFMFLYHARLERV